MNTMDAVMLSRMQFALTIMFHYLFPPLTIGLGVFLVFLEARYLKTKDPQFKAAAKFWTKLFALNFALGVASGIVMEFQFGTNWATYSRYVGDVFGSDFQALITNLIWIIAIGFSLLGLFTGVVIYPISWVVQRVRDTKQQQPCYFTLPKQQLNSIVDPMIVNGDILINSRA